MSGKKSNPRLNVRRHDGGSTSGRLAVGGWLFVRAARPSRGVAPPAAGFELGGLLGGELAPLLVDVDLFPLVPLLLLAAAALLARRHGVSMPRGSTRSCRP